MTTDESKGLFFRKVSYVIKKRKRKKDNFINTVPGLPSPFLLDFGEGAGLAVLFD